MTYTIGHLMHPHEMHTSAASEGYTCHRHISGWPRRVELTMVLQLQLAVKHHEFWGAQSSVGLCYLLCLVIQVGKGVACTAARGNLLSEQPTTFLDLPGKPW